MHRSTANSQESLLKTGKEEKEYHQQWHNDVSHGVPRKSVA